MIDTSKYEGHTPGPWTAEYGDYITHVTNSDKVVVASVGFELDKDGQFIADAPLLLEEVKRLRRVLEDIESMIPDNHEEVSPILSDILNECHRVLPMFNEVIE